MSDLTDLHTYDTHNTFITSNGAGLKQPIEALFARLASHTLDPIWEEYGNFSEKDDPAIDPGFTRFFGNFYDYSHVFQIDSNDPDVVARLTAAIRANQATPAYAKAKAERAAAVAQRIEDDRLKQAKRIAASYEDDIPRDLAIRAHSGTSFSPDTRGDSERKGYAAQLGLDYEALVKLADTEEKRVTLDQEFQGYRAGYRERYIARLSSLSRCMSTMITGGSNFPTRRNQKASDAADKRTRELVEYRVKVLDAIRKTLCPELRPIMSGDDDATDRLAEKIATAEAEQARMTAANAAIRKHKKAGASAQVTALMALGYSHALATAILEPDAMGRIGYASYQLTNNNANIRRMKERLAQVSEAHASVVTEIEGAHARMEDNPPENRVRLYFPGKPDLATRSALKAKGFRWSPTLGCWQAYRNDRSLRYAAVAAGVPTGAPEREVAHV